MEPTYMVGPPILDINFSDKISRGDLEKCMQESFAARGMEVVPDYLVKDSKNYPKNLSFVVFPVDDKNELLGGLIATEEAAGDFTFTYYDKIFVVPSKWNNGIAKGMIDVANTISQDKNRIPGVLRTSDFGVSQYYKSSSDIVTYGLLGIYDVHGFGFKDKKTEEPLFENAEDLFTLAAQYIVTKPATLIKKQS